jgi:hypothetical protein
MKKSKYTESQIAFVLKQIVADLSLDKQMLQEVENENILRNKNIDFSNNEWS